MRTNKGALANLVIIGDYEMMNKDGKLTFITLWRADDWGEI